MAVEKAWIIGVENLVSWYGDMADPECPYFSVWGGKYLRFMYDGTDVEEGKEILMTNLMMAAECKNSAVMTIKLHRHLSNGVVNDKTPYSASIDFRCVAIEEDGVAMGKLHGDAAWAEVGALREQVKALKAAKPKGIMGHLETLLENEEVQVQLTQGVMGFVNLLAAKFLSPKGAMAVASATPDQEMIHQGATMAGVDDMNATEEDQLNSDLQRLETQDPKILEHLTKLADLSIKNPPLFQMLITQLEGM
jgi:hypothetical protein